MGSQNQDANAIVLFSLPLLEGNSTRTAGNTQMKNSESGPERALERDGREGSILNSCCYDTSFMTKDILDQSEPSALKNRREDVKVYCILFLQSRLLNRSTLDRST